MQRLTGLFGRGLLTGVLLVAAFWLGSSVRREPTVSAADTRRNPPREAFLAGSERSIPILQEISVTLKRIDTRLARLEKLAQGQPRP